MQVDPSLPEGTRERIKAAMGRYYGRKAAHNRALIARWNAQADARKEHRHVATLIVTPESETPESIVLDEAKENRCTLCNLLMGFPS